MISLINGLPQNPQSVIQPLGSVTFTLNIDATIIANPFGIVMGGSTVRMYFDATGKLITTGGANQIWSNLELNPQTSGTQLGTWYTVNFYDQDGARTNLIPQTWQFTLPNGSTLDIGTMTAINVPGIIYFPNLSSGGGSNVDTVVPLNTSGTIAAPGAGINFFCPCTSGAGGISNAMPSAAGLGGQVIKAIKIDTGVGSATFTGIEGGAVTYSLSNLRQYVIFESDGTNWHVMGNN